MRIYLVERPDEAGYEEFESFVCVATSQADARLIHPYDSIHYSSWLPSGTILAEAWPVDPSQLKVTMLGFALDNHKRGVMLASFKNA